MKFTIELTEKQANQFVQWVAEWFRYDEFDITDSDLRNAISVIGQIMDQLQKEKKENEI